MTILPEDRVYARHRRRRGAVLVVGAGAVGGFVAVELARLGVSPLWLLDRDHMDVGNLVRHPLGAGDLGRPKALALAEQIQRDFPPCEVTGVFEDFLELTEDEQLRLVGQADVVVAATDTVACQRRINEVCLTARVPAVYPGVWVDRDVPDAEVGEILWVHPDRHTPCYLCATSWRGQAGDAEARGGTRADIQVLVMATVSVVAGLLDPQDERARILNDQRTLMLAHAFMPTSEQFRDLFFTRDSLQYVRVPFPNTPCPACDQQAAELQPPVPPPLVQLPEVQAPEPPTTPHIPVERQWPQEPAPPTQIYGDEEPRLSSFLAQPFMPLVLILGTVIGLVCLIGAIASISQGSADSGSGVAAAPTNTATQPIQQAPAAPAGPAGTRVQPIQITDPPRENPPHQVPRVIQVTGIGDIPQGRHLWIFVHAPGNGLYYPQGKVDSPGPKPWVVWANVGSDITDNTGKAEDDGQVFAVYALLTDDATDAQIRAHSGGYSEEEWQTSLATFSSDSTPVERSG